MIRPLASVVALSLLAAAADAQVFDCTINSAASGINGTFTVNVAMPGTLIGNWDAATNAGGTRTKTGLFGTFGATENLPVNISLSGGVNNSAINTNPAGGFTLLLDLDGQVAIISEYAVNLIASGPLVIPFTTLFTTEAFRTRVPTSTYIAGSINVPIGNANVSVFRTVQTGGGTGTLVETGPNTYTFAVPVELDLIYEAELLGSPLSSPGGSPTVAVIAGSVTLQPDGTALISTSQDIGSSVTQSPNQALPAVPFALPTILPPGSTANVLLNLTLQTLSTTTTGTQSLVIVGTPRSCFADFNQDGGIDAADVDAFFGAWEAGEGTADVNQDGGVDSGDVDTFFAAWEAGGC